jgi:hypothetical protein
LSIADLHHTKAPRRNVSPSRRLRGNEIGINLGSFDAPDQFTPT